MTIKVSQSKFNEMESMISTENIPEGYAKGYVTVKGVPYVITGACGTGTGNGWQYLYGNKIVDLRLYSGTLTPLSYSDHNNAVNNNERERGYNCMLIKCNDIDVVILPEQTVFAVEESEKQLNLFI